MKNELCITLDMDWAPDFVINQVAELLIEKKVKCTWFATHMSKEVLELVKNPLFEIGIHPNFLSNSTHGNNPREILSHMKELFPTAKSIRTHSLFQSTPVLKIFHQFGLENDSSILLENTSNISPHYSNFFKLYRFPYFWEDDVSMIEKYDWTNKNLFSDFSGLRIFNFHPIHIYLNSHNMENYNKIKSDIGLPNIGINDIKKFINNNNGTKTFFKNLIDFIKDKKTYTINDLQNEFF